MEFGAYSLTVEAGGASEKLVLTHNPTGQTVSVDEPTLDALRLHRDMLDHLVSDAGAVANVAGAVGRWFKR